MRLAGRGRLRHCPPGQWGASRGFEEPPAGKGPEAFATQMRLQETPLHPGTFSGCAPAGATTATCQPYPLGERVPAWLLVHLLVAAFEAFLPNVARPDTTTLWTFRDRLRSHAYSA